jgi:hypothetical protein
LAKVPPAVRPSVRSFESCLARVLPTRAGYHACKNPANRLIAA